MISLPDHFTRLINDLVKRIDRYEQTQQELLAGFPEKYASKEEVEKLRGEAIELQTTIVGRDRFELLEKQVAENTGKRTATIAVLGFVAAVILAALSWNNSQINEARDTSNHNREDVVVIDNKITTLQLKLTTLQDKLQLLCHQEQRENHTIC